MDRTVRTKHDHPVRFYWQKPVRPDMSASLQNCAGRSGDFGRRVKSILFTMANIPILEHLRAGYPRCIRGLVLRIKVEHGIPDDVQDPRELGRLIAEQLRTAWIKQ